jgi:hypothetical protein
MIPELQATPEIARGTLVEIDPRGRLEAPLYWYRWSRSSDLLEAFTNVLIANGKKLLA